MQQFLRFHYRILIPESEGAWHFSRKRDYLVFLTALIYLQQMNIRAGITLPLFLKHIPLYRYDMEMKNCLGKINLQNAMAETTFTICTIFRLLIPAEFSFSWAWCEIECTEATHVFIRCRGWVWTVSGFISMFNCHFLSVTSVAYCYMDRTTTIQSVVIYSIWPLIGMNLIMNLYPQSETILWELIVRDILKILLG